MDEGKIAGAPVAAAENTPAPQAEAPKTAPAPPKATTPPPAPPAAFAAPPTIEAAPELVASPAPAAEVGDVDSLAQQLREELEAAKAAREALDSRAQQAAAVERVKYLRQMGAQGTLTDAHLLTLAPAVDPGTSDGREQLHAWVESNSALFTQRGPTPIEIQQATVERLPSSTNGVFGRDLQEQVLRAVFGKGGR